jgi:hypothetical protein
MNIRTSDLRKFQKLSSHIKPNGIAPASDCIRFGGGVMTKNAYSAFVTYHCPDANEDLLVEEHVINSLLSTTSADFFNITIKNEKVIVSDGRDKVPFGFINMDTYTNTPSVPTVKTEISKEFLNVLGRAAEVCAAPKDPSTVYMFVHVGDNMMAAGNGWSGVVFPIEEDLKMVIGKQTAMLVSKYDFTETGETEGHYFFFAKDVIMGFSKQEIGYSEMGKIMRGGKEEFTFTASATDVLSFNALALSLCKDWAIVTMKTGEFEMIDSRFDYTPTRPAEQLRLPEPFHYNADNMNLIVKALDVEELDFHNSKNAYFIRSSDTTARAIIAKISKQ